MSRNAERSRNTRETEITVRVALDGTGTCLTEPWDGPEKRSNAEWLL